MCLKRQQHRQSFFLVFIEQSSLSEKKTTKKTRQDIQLIYASTTQQTLVCLRRLSKWLQALKAEMSFLMMGGSLTRGGGCIYTARNRTGWGERWLLRGEAIYFLSGLEMSEKKKYTNASREGGAPKADYAETMLFFLNRYKCSRYPVDPPECSSFSRSV